MESFSISRAESGFPVFQNVLELENDRRQAPERLANLPDAGHAQRRDGRLHPAPQGVSCGAAKSMAERLYLEDIKDGDTFGPFTLAETAAVSVNPEDDAALLSGPLGHL